MTARELPLLFEDVLRPLDVARRETLRRTLRLPAIGPVLRSVESRAVVVASTGVVLAFIFTILAPGALFVLGPALFGVLHVGSDVRYLLLRPAVPRRWLMAVTLASVALIVWRLLEMVLPRALPFAHAEVGFGWAWILAGAWIGASAAADARRWRRAALATVPLVVIFALAVWQPARARALLAYGHNLVALVIWVACFRRRRLAAELPLALVAASLVLLLTGAGLDRLSLDGPWVTRWADEARASYAGLGPRSALLVGLTYVFLQAVHYSVWLAWIPQEEVRGDATLTFRMSARAAARDLGTAGLSLVVVAAMLVAASSFVSVHRTRGIYLSLATFHTYLELACLAFFWARGRGPRGAQTK